MAHFSKCQTIHMSTNTPLVTLSDPEIAAIRKQTSENEFQIAIKPQAIRIGKHEHYIHFAGKFLHVEYQGYNKVVDLDLEGFIIRALTTENIRGTFGAIIDISFSKGDLFLFNKRDGNRIVF